jgi:hypothetical protein
MATMNSNSHDTKDVGNKLSLLTYFRVTFEFKLISNQSASRLTILCITGYMSRILSIEDV